MIRSKVYFTGLVIDPSQIVEQRWSKGVIPLDWHRIRFVVPPDISFPVSKLNRWLADNIEGRWAAYVEFAGEDREMMVAFERDYDGVAFVLANGKVEAFCQ